MVYTQNSARCTHATARKGFTLIEILIAIAIVGIVAYVTVPYFLGIFEGAKKNTTKQSLRALKSAINLFDLDVGKPPKNIKDLIRRPSVSDYYDQDEVSNWNGYLEKVPKDAWGRPFKYRLTPESEHAYELYSHGGKKGSQEKRAKRIRVWGKR